MYSYSSTSGATGTGSATAGTASNVGGNGVSITFSSTQTYASGDSYRVRVGTQNSAAINLEDQFSGASITAYQGANSAPKFINRTASVIGASERMVPRFRFCLLDSVQEWANTLSFLELALSQMSTPGPILTHRTLNIQWHLGQPQAPALARPLRQRQQLTSSQRDPSQPACGRVLLVTAMITIHRRLS